VGGGTSVEADNIFGGAAAAPDTAVWGASLDAGTGSVVWGPDVFANVDDRERATAIRRRAHVAAPGERR
jgi:hypothetical protein